MCECTCCCRAEAVEGSATDILDSPLADSQPALSASSSQKETELFEIIEKLQVGFFFFLCDVLREPSPRGTLSSVPLGCIREADWMSSDVNSHCL